MQGKLDSKGIAIDIFDIQHKQTSMKNIIYMTFVIEILIASRTHLYHML